ncbi:MAG: GIY-YIG nuclease family protein [Elusimicrobia bacterium]|nr:GIY-YIG nuclease family protein [Elusimicrobiota bacterium]
MTYTYVLKSLKDGKLYTGCSNDLKKRFNEHKKGEVEATKDRCPFEIIYYEACIDKSDALAREKFLKTGAGKRYLKNRLKRFLALMGNKI